MYRVALLFLLFVLSCQFNRKTDLTQPFDLASARNKSEAAWASLPQRLARIQPPNFAKTIYSIEDYGAVADTTIDSRAAILQAIQTATTNGGGRVLIPAGTYQSNGPIHLQDGVELHLQEGATLRFSDEPTHYLPLAKVRWEGTVCWNWSPLIYAYQKTNIGITGSGRIDGNGKSWSVAWRKRQKADQTQLRQMGNDVIADEKRVFGNGFLDLDGDGQDDGYGDGQTHYLRPGLLHFYDCKNILLADFSIQDSPFWTIHLPFCQNVTAKGLKIYGETLNDDGIDPDSSKDVLIEDCFIQTHDDAIAIKAGRDQDAWDRGASRNIIIRNCVLNSGVNAIAIGSEMSGNVQEVFIENCQVKSGQYALNFKTNLDRGGQVGQVFVRAVRADSLESGMISFRMDYHGYRGNHYPTSFHDFYISDVSCRYAGKHGISIVGVEAAPIHRVWLSQLGIEQAAQAVELEKVEDIILENVVVNGKSW